MFSLFPSISRSLEVLFGLFYLAKGSNKATSFSSFAILQMTLVFAKMLYTYDMEMLDPNLDWEAKSKHFIMWWKAPIRIRLNKRLAKSA